MNVSLTPQLELFVKKKLDSGLYYSASEVIRDGLRLLEEKDQMREMKLAELRKEIQLGIDSGEATPLDMDEIIKEASLEYEQRKGE